MWYAQPLMLLVLILLVLTLLVLVLLVLILLALMAYAKMCFLVKSSGVSLVPLISRLYSGWVGRQRKTTYPVLHWGP